MGGHLRDMTGHKGYITTLIYVNEFGLLISGSIDGQVGVWDEKGYNLQMTATGGPITALAVHPKLRLVVVGSNGVLHFFRVDLKDATLLKQNKRSEAQEKANRRGGLPAGAAAAAAAAAALSGDVPLVLRRLWTPLRGPDLTHRDIIKSIACTETNKIITVGLDRCMFIYEYEKLDKIFELEANKNLPRDKKLAAQQEHFIRIRAAHNAGLVSVAYDGKFNILLTGAQDGSLRTWSAEGRLLDKYDTTGATPQAQRTPTTHCRQARQFTPPLQHVHTVPASPPAGFLHRIGQLSVR